MLVLGRIRDSGKRVLSIPGLPSKWMPGTVAILSNHTSKKKSPLTQKSINTDASAAGQIAIFRATPPPIVQP
jgi:hypothetical protein